MLTPNRGIRHCTLTPKPFLISEPGLRRIRSVRVWAYDLQHQPSQKLKETKSPRLCQKLWFLPRICWRNIGNRVFGFEALACSFRVSTASGSDRVVQIPCQYRER